MSESTIYYGHIDKVEIADLNNPYIEFHCLQKNMADKILQAGFVDFNNSLLEIPSIVITLENNLAAIQKFSTFENILDAESNWVLLTTNDSQEGLQADLFVENQEQQTLIFLASISPIPDDENGTLNLLKEKVSLPERDAKEQDILETLEVNRSQPAEFIAVYNVGQGNCNAVCNDGGQPLLYYDMGGGCYKNKNTYRTTLTFCFSMNPPILLSHWDMDHFESARRTSAMLAATWILPRQVIGPVHLKFFLSITGTKLIWPSTLPSLSFYWGEIVLCTGPTGKKNHTGLAFLASLSPRRNGIKAVMLPADAAYYHIPGSTTSFDAIVATHHGAEFYNANSPVSVAKGKKAIAYSFGSRNSYGHPKRHAISAHISAGWPRSNKKNTHAGHIALCDISPTVRLACAAGHCSLAIVQHY